MAPLRGVWPFGLGRRRRKQKKKKKKETDRPVCRVGRYWWRINAKKTSIQFKGGKGRSLGGSDDGTVVDDCLCLSLFRVLWKKKQQKNEQETKQMVIKEDLKTATGK